MFNFLLKFYFYFWNIRYPNCKNIVMFFWFCKCHDIIYAVISKRFHIVSITFLILSCKLRKPFKSILGFLLYFISNSGVISFMFLIIKTLAFLAKYSANST